MTHDETLRIRNLTVSLGRGRIIEDLTLPEIRRGEIMAVVGPNGSGKSTLIRAIAQVIPSSGTLAFGKADLRRIAPRKRAGLIGYMPQILPLTSELTAIESVVAALRSDPTATEPERRAAAALALLGISKLSLRSLDRMSGGERQIVGLTQAIAREPQFLLLDEPTSALDLSRQLDVMRFLRERAVQGAAILVVLHDLTLAARWADRMIVLSDGGLYGQGTPADMLTSDMLADVYRIPASVERVRDHLVIITESGNSTPETGDTSQRSTP